MKCLAAQRYCALFCLFFSYLFSQQTTYQFPEKFNAKYDLHPYDEYKRILNSKVQGQDDAKGKLFMIQNIFERQRWLDENGCYLNWYDLEKYLNRLLDTVIPKNIRKELPCTIFINRSPRLGIYSADDSCIYINIGLLAYQYDESELAAILARAVAYHYLEQNDTVKSSFTEPRDKHFSNLYENKWRYEQVKRLHLKADSFAYTCVENAGYNLKSMMHIFESLDFTDRNSVHYINKLYRDGHTEYDNIFSSNDLGRDRIELLEKCISKQKGRRKNFIVDSVFFAKIRKTSIEEVKKINFEENRYRACLNLAFAEYLTGNNSPKNMYFIFESIRRLLYKEPELAKKGFLGENLQFSEFENVNYGILELPEMLFLDSIQYQKALSHPLLTTTEKAFNTYQQAYFYFVDFAENKGMNEATFSKALYYYAQKDAVNFSDNISKYLEKGGGLFTSFANSLKNNGYPKLSGGKTTVIFDNISRLSMADNYYQAIKRKVLYNNEIKTVFLKDSLNMNLILINELVGLKPMLLHTYQKYISDHNSLYTEADREIFEIVRVNKRETMEEKSLRNRYNKHLMIYIPEWFSWAQQNNVSGVCLLDAEYEYRGFTDENEYHNYYLLSYCNFSDDKPYFKKCFRNGNVRKQTHKEIATDVSNFLFKKE